MDDLEKARRRRDSAVSMQIGDVARDGKTISMVALPDGLYIVSERAIHKIQLADQIDPGFEHPNTPNINQRFASSGADSPIVSRTFLQAHRLFSEPHYNRDKGGEVKTAVLAGTQELLGAEDILQKLQADLISVEKDLPDGHEGALSLPAVSGPEARGKAFVQRAEHALQVIFRVFVIFYGDKRKPGFFDGVAAHIKENFSDDENFVAFADGMANFAKLIRGLRHSIEHPKPNQEIDFLNYHFTDGQVHRPSVRVTHPDVPFNFLPLDDFMGIIIENLVKAFESMIVHLAINNVRPLGKMPISVGEHPKFGQGHLLVKYTYLIGMGDPLEWHPLD